MKTFKPGDWVEQNGLPTQILGTSTSLDGKQFAYVSSGTSFKKIKDFLKDGGIISLISGFENFIVDKVSSEDLVKTKAPFFSYKVGDVVFCKKFSSYPLKVLEVKDTEVILATTTSTGSSFNSFKVNPDEEAKYNLSSDLKVIKLPKNPVLFAASDLQVGDEIEVQTTHTDYTFLKNKYGTTTFKVASINTNGSFNLINPAKSDKSLSYNYPLIAGQHETSEYYTAYWSNNFVISKKAPLKVNRVPSAEINLKQNAIDASYRIAARKISSLLKEFIISNLKKHKAKKSQIAVMAELLDSEIGKSLIAYILGMLLTQAAKDNPKIQRLAEEFRVEGLAIAENALLDLLMSQLTDFAIPILKNLPSVQVAQMPLISAESKEDEVEENVQEIVQEKVQLTI